LASLLFAGPHAASAQIATAHQATPAPAVAAVVDDDGKLVPLEAMAAKPERIGEAGDANAVASPCPAAKPLAFEEARALVIDVATRENFFPDFVVAVAKIESQFNSIALSDKSAYGLMQLEPATAKRFAVDICDPADNVLGGVRYLRYLHDRYKNPMFILSAYNAGEERMLEFRGIPPFPETVKFVAGVLNEFYDWPIPETAISAASHRDRESNPSVVPDHDATLARARRETGDGSWSEGFVKHID